MYTTRKDIKTIARQVVVGPDGYNFRVCSQNASKVDQDAIAESNRALVELLTTKSAYTYYVCPSFIALHFTNLDLYARIRVMSP